MDFIAEHQPNAEKAKDVLFDLLEFKRFLVSLMKTQNIDVAEAVSSVTEVTSQTLYQDDSPRGVKLLALLERILKALTVKFGLVRVFELWRRILKRVIFRTKQVETPFGLL